MNEIIENMKTRRSIRKFKSDALPQDVLDRILEAGTYAPTGIGVLPVNRTIKNNKFLYRQPNYGWRYFYATFVY
jgi:nitroreductase